MSRPELPIGSFFCDKFQVRFSERNSEKVQGQKAEVSQKLEDIFVDLAILQQEITQEMPNRNLGEMWQESDLYNIFSSNSRSPEDIIHFLNNLSKPENLQRIKTIILTTELGWRELYMILYHSSGYFEDNLEDLSSPDSITKINEILRSGCMSSQDLSNFIQGYIRILTSILDELSQPDVIRKLGLVKEQLIGDQGKYRKFLLYSKSIKVGDKVGDIVENLKIIINNQSVIDYFAHSRRVVYRDANAILEPTVPPSRSQGNMPVNPLLQRPNKRPNSEIEEGRRLRQHMQQSTVNSPVAHDAARSNDDLHPTFTFLYPPVYRHQVAAGDFAPLPDMSVFPVATDSAVARVPRPDFGAFPDDDLSSVPALIQMSGPVASARAPRAAHAQAWPDMPDDAVEGAMEDEEDLGDDAPPLPEALRQRIHHPLPSLPHAGPVQPVMRPPVPAFATAYPGIPAFAFASQLYPRRSPFVRPHNPDPTNYARRADNPPSVVSNPAHPDAVQEQERPTLVDPTVLQGSRFRLNENTLEDLVRITAKEYEALADSGRIHPDRHPKPNGAGGVSSLPGRKR